MPLPRQQELLELLNNRTKWTLELVIAGTAPFPFDTNKEAVEYQLGILDIIVLDYQEYRKQNGL
jgi:hypothetical protein